MKCRYVVRASVPSSIEKEWAEWMRNVHIPALTALPWFNGAHFYKQEISENGVSAYIMIYESMSRESLQEYLESDECRVLRAEFNEQYDGKVTLSREIWHEQE